MSIALNEGSVCLSGRRGAEDAPLLLAMLRENPDAPVDLSACEEAHTALVQILLVARRRLAAPPASGFLRRWLVPQLS
jgi:hypothetical protein